MSPTVETLRALVFAVWASLSPRAAKSPDAAVIADAIATSVAADLDPVFGDTELEAATMARWAWEESRLSTEPRPFSWDSKAHISCGVWQERCSTMPPSVLGQAEVWIALAHAGASWCPESPLAPLSGSCRGFSRRISDRRVEQTRRVVNSQRQSDDEEVGRE